MRFALIATGAAAIAALPAVVVLSGPQMESRQFLSAVRCAAYESVSSTADEFGPVRYRLNAEARRQPIDTAVQAQIEARTIAREAAGIANGGDTAILNQVRASACAEAGSQIARGAGAPDAA